MHVADDNRARMLVSKKKRGIWVLTVNVSNNDKLNKFDVITVNNSTEVAEGRYIKGDPLRGYYDFIITEGSYKFWASFQVFYSPSVQHPLCH